MLTFFEKDGQHQIIIAAEKLRGEILLRTPGVFKMIDQAGNVLGEGFIEHAQPSVVSPTRQSLADRRAAICRNCGHNDGLTRYTVKCRGCGCAGLSLFNGVCKLGKWPAEISETPAE